MADLYGLEASGIDPEMAAKMLGLKSKRAIAEAMLQQSMGGLQAPPTPAGGYAVPISPLAGVAKVLQAYMAEKQMKGIDEEGAKLAGEGQRRMGEMLQGYERGRTGTPAQPIADAGPGDGVDTATTMNAVPGNKRQAIIDLLSKAPGMATSPLIRADMAEMQKADQPYTLTAGAQRFSADNKPLAQAGFKPDRAKAPMTDFQIAQLKNMIAQGADIGLDVGPMQEELRAALAGRSAVNGPPQMPVAPPAGIPPEVIAAAQSGKPFVATQVPGQAPQFQTPPGGLAPRDARNVAVDAAKSRINVNEARDKSNFDPTVQKEIIQTDDELSAAKSGINSLQQALKLNDSAMGFPLAGAAATAGSFLPESVRPKTVDATQLLDNTLTSGALPQMRAIFGANPTEGERKILLDIQGSSSKNPAVRKEIINRAIEAVNARIAVNQGKAEKLRSGTYFSPQTENKVRVVDW